MKVAGVKSRPDAGDRHSASRFAMTQFLDRRPECASRADWASRWETKAAGSSRIWNRRRSKPPQGDNADGPKLAALL
jgi:hypothetical protein